jgi:carbamoyltransferase
MWTIRRGCSRGSESRDESRLYHQLLTAFKTETGCGVLVNTSFNVRGEPPVLSPPDAYKCFVETEIVLVMGRYVVEKAK